MKSRICILIISVLLFRFGIAQNILPNGDFENYSAMPGSLGEWDKCIGWSNLNGNVGVSPSFGSPDYFHTNAVGWASLPNSIAGTVYPYSGDAVMGFVTYASSSNFREYLSCPFSSPMVVGVNYQISFWITSGSSNLYNCLSSNRIGVRFTTGTLSQPGSGVIAGTPQLEIAGQVWTNSWQLATFTFTADSAYNHFAIGNFYNDGATSYTLHMPYTHANAYYFIDDIKVISDNHLQIAGDSSMCIGSSVTLKAQNDTTFSWAESSTPSLILGNDSLLTVSPLTTSTYFIYGSNDTASFTVTVFNNPLVNLGNDTTLCQSETLNLSSTSLNAAYKWQDNSTNAFFSVTQANTYWLEVTLNGCKARDTIIVNYNVFQNPNLGNDTTLCHGDNVTLVATIPNSTYLWQNNSTSSTFSVTQPGIYSVQVSVNNCSKKDTITVNYNQFTLVNIGNDTILCQGDSLLLDATSANAIYLWQDNSSNPTFNINQQGNYFVTVTANNCSRADTININYNNFYINLGNNTTLCQGESLMLDIITSDATYLWQDNSTNSAFNVTQQGTYKVCVTVYSCSKTDSINVSYNPLIDIDFGNDTTLCEDETLVLNASTPNASYLWQNNSVNSICNVINPGTYWVKVTSSNCIKTDTINVLYKAALTVSLGNDTTLCQGEQLKLDATSTSNVTYLWQNNSTDPNLTISEQGKYWIKLFNNCEAITDTLIVGMEICRGSLYVPNSFSPDRNGLNDVFNIYAYDISSDNFELSIFDRWGRCSFKTNDISEGWTGSLNNIGEPAPIGIYVYHIIYKEITGKKRTLYGHVSLIR